MRRDSDKPGKPRDYRKYMWVSDQIALYFKRRGYWPDVAFVQRLIGYNDREATMRFLRRGIRLGYFVVTEDIVSSGRLRVCDCCGGTGHISIKK